MFTEQEVVDAAVKTLRGGFSNFYRRLFREVQARHGDLLPRRMKAACRAIILDAFSRLQGITIGDREIAAPAPARVSQPQVFQLKTRVLSELERLHHRDQALSNHAHTRAMKLSLALSDGGSCETCGTPKDRDLEERLERAQRAYLPFSTEARLKLVAAASIQKGFLDAGRLAQFQEAIVAALDEEEPEVAERILERIAAGTKIGRPRG